MRSINLFVCVFIALVSCEDPEPFEIIENHVKFLNDTTGRVIEDLQLGYYFSVETGGYTNKVYHGKICKAYHPDQFYENCYQKRKGEDLIWYMTKSAIDPKYDETKLTQCFWEEDGFCRYKDQNGKTIYLSDVIIVDSDIVFDERPNSVFGLLKFFENSDNVLILETFFRLPKIIDFKEVSVNVHHLIDFNCPLLSREMKITMTLIVGY